MRTTRVASALLVASLTGVLFAGPVDIYVDARLRTSVSVIGMLPATAPAGFDTIRLEEILEEQLESRGIRVVSSVDVGEVMSAMRIKRLTQAERAVLGRKLGVDAFMVASVDAASTGMATTYSLFGIADLHWPISKKIGSVRLTVLDALGGTVLLEGRSQGVSHFRSKEGVVERNFERILEVAFPPRAS